VFFSLEKLSEWLSSKSPRHSSFELSQRNIYIFPSSLGFGFLLLLVLMLLTAINYQNSLIYLLTFFLGTLFFLSIWMCFLNLSELKIETAGVVRCFEGDGKGVRYRIRLSKSPALPLAIKVGIHKNGAQLIPYSQGDLVDIDVMAEKKPRGRYRLNRLYLESRFPFGLVVSWTWLKLDAECWVYPSPVYAPPDGESHQEDDQQNRLLTRSAEMHDLKEYQYSDPTNRIIWKKYAAKDELIIRYSEGSNVNPQWVDWDHYSGLTEDRLKYLCFDVCKLSAANFTFGFKIPGVLVEPSSGTLHKQACLDALALFQ
tara:strand:- start:41255 stop:42193 length:939 start_codon:yes stop_codon:yes gene_type:complete